MFLIQSLHAQRNTSGSEVVTKHSFSPAKSPNDTLLPGNLPFVPSPDYVMVKSENGGFVLGSNGWNDKCKCQEYRVTYYYKIEGAIYWFGWKRADSSELLSLSVWDMDGNSGTTHDTNNQKCPETLLATVSDTVKNIDTSSTLASAHVVWFDAPLLIQSGYCIGFDMSAMLYDSIALVSTASGEGGNLELVWEQWSNNGWYTLQGAQWDSGSLDLDAMILPIIDNTAGADEQQTYGGGIVMEILPNPATDFLNASCVVEEPGRWVEAQLLDIRGVLLRKQKYLVGNDGRIMVQFDLVGVDPGTCLLVIKTHSGGVARRVQVVR